MKKNAKGVNNWDRRDNRKGGSTALLLHWVICRLYPTIEWVVGWTNLWRGAGLDPPDS